MNLRILTSVIPVAVFFALTRVAPPWVAILCGFAATGVVTYKNRSDRLIGMLAVYGFAIVTVCAVVGIAGGNEKAYLASGPISDFLFAPLYLASLLWRKPLIGGVAKEMFPAYTHHIPDNAKVFIWLSVLWAIYNIGQGVLRSWLLSFMSVGEYIIWSRLLTWPFTAVVLAVTLYAVYRAAKHHGGLEGDWFRRPEPEAVPVASDAQ